MGMHASLERVFCLVQYYDDVRFCSCSTSIALRVSLRVSRSLSISSFVKSYSSTSPLHAYRAVNLIRAAKERSVC